MRYDPEDAKWIILAACALHNWLRTDSVGRGMYTPPTSVDNEDILTGTLQPGVWRNEQGTGMRRLANQGGNRHPVCALEIRNTFCEYFNNVGAVPWQDRMINVPQT